MQDWLAQDRFVHETPGGTGAFWRSRSQRTVKGAAEQVERFGEIAAEFGGGPLDWAAKAGRSFNKAVLERFRRRETGSPHTTDKTLEHDPEKSVPVFRKDHAQTES